MSEPLRASTGHIIGATYFSRLYCMHYVVEATATVWELARAGAVRVRWENGNVGALTGPSEDDALVPSR